MTVKSSDTDTTPGSSFDDMIAVSGGTDLVPEDEAVVAVAREYTNAPELDMDDMAMPRIRLAQGLTPEVQEGQAKPGEYVLTGYDSAAEVELIPMLFARARAYRDSERNVLCRSGNGVVGSGDPGGECAKCPLSQWSNGTDKDGKRVGVAPKCDFSYSYVCWSVTHETPVTLELSKTGIAAAKFLNTQIRGRGLGNFKIRMSSQAQKGPRGSYYVPLIRLGSALTDEERAAIEALPLSL